MNKINSLLDNIEIKRHDAAFKIYRKETTSEFNANTISSGESELISLGIECLIFSRECISDKENILFLLLIRILGFVNNDLILIWLL